jgi:hypothetical protein
MQLEITSKISALVERAPKNWAINVGLIMKKKTSTVYSLANGRRGKKDKSQRVLLHSILKKMVRDHEEETLKKLD